MPLKTFFLPKGTDLYTVKVTQFGISEYSLLWWFSFYSTPPDNLSIQEFQKNEAIDVEVNSCS